MGMTIAWAAHEDVHSAWFGSGCRENTEGEYSGLEHEVVPDVVESLKIITEARCALSSLACDAPYY